MNSTQISKEDNSFLDSYTRLRLIATALIYKFSIRC